MDQMKICPRCGTSVGALTRFCENCGYQFTDVAPIGAPSNASDIGITVAASDIGTTVAAPQGGQLATGQNAYGAQPQAAAGQNAYGTQPQMDTAQGMQLNNGMPQGGQFDASSTSYAAPQSPYMSPQQMQLQQPKKGNGGVIAAIVTVLVLLIVGGVVAAGFALGWFGGSKAKEIEVSTGDRLTMQVGDVEQIDITNFDDLGKVTLEYQTSDRHVVKISQQYQNGLDIEAAGEGEATITISGGKYDDVVIEVTVERAVEVSDTTQRDDNPVTTLPALDDSVDIGLPEEGGMPDGLDQNADGSYNLWYSSYSGEDQIVGKIYVVDGYTIDDVYSSASTIFCDSKTMDGIYYSCYSDMPYEEWDYVRYGEVPEEGEFEMEIQDLGMDCNGSELYCAYRYYSENTYSEYEMYYIFYEYEIDGYIDYVTIELYPAQAEHWDKSDFQDFARAVFGL